MKKCHPKLIEYARQNRKPMPPGEWELWKFLRDRSLRPLIFRRQHPIGAYIADFYCAKARLVVEVDGMGHIWRSEKDIERDAYMQSIGIMVVRIPFRRIVEDPNGIASFILETTRARYDEFHPSLDWEGR